MNPGGEDLGLDPRARRLLALLNGAGAGAQDLAARRAGLVELARVAGEDPCAAGPSGEDLDLRIGESRHRVRRHRAPEGSGAGVLFLHGGGFVAGGLETHDALCRRLCRAAAADVFALAYPLAPERPFPAALDAAEGALQLMAADAEALGLDPQRLAVAGDSAGGALAAAASLAAARRSAPLRAALLICPILDLAAQFPSRRAFATGYFVEAEAFAADVAAYAGGRDLSDPRLSPLRSPSLADAPPTLLHLAPFDPFHDEGLAYAAALAEAGVQVKTTDHAGMIHYFAALGGALPAARRAVDQMGAELGALLNA